jgi:hypothetical protein
MRCLLRAARSRRRTWVALAALSLAACGDGDDGDDNGINPPEDDDDSEFSLPLDVGGVWTYQEVTSTIGIAGADSATILLVSASSEPIGAHDFTCLVTDEDGIRDATYSCDADAAVFLRQEGAEIFIADGELLHGPATGDAVEDWIDQTLRASLPWKVGEVGTEGNMWSLVEGETEIPTSEGAAALTLSGVVHSLGMEAVDVPAGRYAAYRSRVIVVVRVETPVRDVTFRTTSNYWFSDQIGITRVHFRSEEIEQGEFLTEEVDTRLIAWDLGDPRGWMISK